MSFNGKYTEARTGWCTHHVTHKIYLIYSITVLYATKISLSIKLIGSWIFLYTQNPSPPGHRCSFSLKTQQTAAGPFGARKPLGHRTATTGLCFCVMFFSKICRSDRLEHEQHTREHTSQNSMCIRRTWVKPVLKSKHGLFLSKLRSYGQIHIERCIMYVCVSWQRVTPQ